MVVVTIPRSLDVTVHIPTESHYRGNRENLTCFKCGGAHHFKSECATWRTRICVRWKNGTCSEPFCSFAHGEEQLRTPWRPFCVKVIRSEDGQILTMGCRQYGHTFNSCPT